MKSLFLTKAQRSFCRKSIGIVPPLQRGYLATQRTRAAHAQPTPRAMRTRAQDHTITCARTHKVSQQWHGATQHVCWRARPCETAGVLRASERVRIRGQGAGVCTGPSQGVQAKPRCGHALRVGGAEGGVHRGVRALEPGERGEPCVECQAAFGTARNGANCRDFVANNKTQEEEEEEQRAEAVVGWAAAGTRGATLRQSYAAPRAGCCYGCCGGKLRPSCRPRLVQRGVRGAAEVAWDETEDAGESSWVATRRNALVYNIARWSIFDLVYVF